MPPAAIGSTPPMPHTRLTSTRAPRPHGTPQGQPAARSEARLLARARVEGRRDGLAAARGEVRQQPRRRRREDADPDPSTVERRCGQNPMDLAGRSGRRGGGVRVAAPCAQWD